MGTRNLIGVIKDKKWVVAQYCQWDGYLDGQGKTVLDTLSNGGVEKLRQKVDNCKFIDREKIRQYYIDAGDSPNNSSGVITLEIADKFAEQHPTLSRDTGATVLDIIIKAKDGEVVELFDQHDFIEDDVFCEYAYVIDFDTNTLKFYACGKQLYAEYPLTKLPTLEEVKVKFENFFGYED
jgi:hypothetical protein